MSIGDKTVIGSTKWLLLPGALFDKNKRSSSSEEIEIRHLLLKKTFERVFSVYILQQSDTKFSFQTLIYPIG